MRDAQSDRHVPHVCVTYLASSLDAHAPRGEDACSNSASGTFPGRAIDLECCVNGLEIATRDWKDSPGGLLRTTRGPRRSLKLASRVATALSLKAEEVHSSRGNSSRSVWPATSSWEIEQVRSGLQLLSMLSFQSACSNSNFLWPQGLRF